MEDKDFKRDSEKDSSLQVDVLAYIIKQQESKNADLVEILAEMFNASIPDRVTISRSGFFGRGKVTKLEIRFDKVTYDIEKSKNGAVTVTHHNVVRGISLKSKPVSMEDCLKAIATELGELEKSSYETKAALTKFVNGR